ncbi:hypothetical protein EWM64_g3071 [Hericium alpestre]|uniref:Uncharacterized protein n=1 Tax=Hericium alpestre TaxID=135208 RepID=A0A4Z0A1I8_9AGAM|nr:hypothetical protein EWM64_g3071 [Hericium alpestre]
MVFGLGLPSAASPSRRAGSLGKRQRARRSSAVPDKDHHDKENISPDGTPMSSKRGKSKSKKTEAGFLSYSTAAPSAFKHGEALTSLYEFGVIGSVGAGFSDSVRSIDSQRSRIAGMGFEAVQFGDWQNEADVRAKELTESPLEDVTDAFVLDFTSLSMS